MFCPTSRQEQERRREAVVGRHCEDRAKRLRNRGDFLRHICALVRTLVWIWWCRHQASSHVFSKAELRRIHRGSHVRRLVDTRRVPLSTAAAATGSDHKASYRVCSAASSDAPYLVSCTGAPPPSPYFVVLSSNGHQYQEQNDSGATTPSLVCSGERRQASETCFPSPTPMKLVRKHCRQVGSNIP